MDDAAAEAEVKRAALVGFAALTLLACFLGRGRFYRGPMTEPSSWDPNVEPAAIVAEARKLIGLWYDPAQGYFGDVGGKLGLIVCMDVPRLAYRNAGTSIKRLLEDDYRAHPDHYGRKDGRPGDPYFDRRARNLYSYCRFNGCLHLTGAPKPGDVVFLSRGANGWISHIALVSEVSPDGRYRIVQASRDEWYVTREEDGVKLYERGWTFRGFGRPLRRVSGRAGARSS